MEGAIMEVAIAVVEVAEIVVAVEEIVAVEGAEDVIEAKSTETPAFDFIIFVLKGPFVKALQYVIHIVMK